MSAPSVYLMSLYKVIYESQNKPMQSRIDVGFCSDITMTQATKSNEVGYQGSLLIGSNKPDYLPRKFIGGSLSNLLDWQAKVSLEQKLPLISQNFLQHNKTPIQI